MTPPIVANSGWRLRAGRIVRFPLVRLLIALTLLALSLLLAHFLASALGWTGPWARALITILLVHATYVGYVRLVERRPTVELNRWAAGKGLVLGALSGVLLFCTVAGLMALVGALHLEAWNGWTGVGSSLAVASVAAFVEEIIFRGVIYRLLEEMIGTWLSVGLSALLFGALHAGNPGATFLGSAAVALEAGVLLAALYVRSRRLWAPIGLHLGWNFTQGGVFGLAVSGNQRAGALSVSTEGPAWLTGGPFGPEASVIAVLLCTIIAVGLLVGASRKRMVMAPVWSERRKKNPLRNG